MSNNKQITIKESEWQPILIAFQKNDFEEVLDLSEKLIKKFPNFAFAYKSKGVALYNLNFQKQSIIYLKAAYLLDENDNDILNNLTVALLNSNLGDNVDDINFHTEELIYLSRIYNKNNCLITALNIIQKAIQINPNDWSVLGYFALCLKNIGEAEKAKEIIQKTLELLKKNNHTEENLLNAFSLNFKVDYYLSNASVKIIKDDIEPYKNIWLNIFKNYQLSNANNTNKLAFNGKYCLKVGFVSGDFRKHAVSKFLILLLKNIHNNNKNKARQKHIETFAFFTVDSKFEDEITLQLKQYFNNWHNISDLNDFDAAKKIKSLGINILIDLSGLSIGNRLPIFAYKPAPIQVSWLGWFGTTGMVTMDYYLADNFCVPM